MIFLLRSPKSHNNDESTNRLIEFCRKQNLEPARQGTRINEQYITIDSIDRNPRFSFDPRLNPRQLKFDGHILAENYKERLSGDMKIRVFEDALLLAEQKTQSFSSSTKSTTLYSSVFTTRSNDQEKAKIKEASIRTCSPIKISAREESAPSSMFSKLVSKTRGNSYHDHSELNTTDPQTTPSQGRRNTYPYGL